MFLKQSIPKNGVFSYLPVFKGIILLIFVVLPLFSSFFAQNSFQDTLKIDTNFKYNIIGNHLTYLIDSKKNLTIEQITKKVDPNLFTPVNEESFSRNIGDKAIWFHLTVENLYFNDNELFMLECQNPDVNNIDVYQVIYNGNVLTSFEKMGDYYPFKNRAKEYHTFAFPFYQRRGTTFEYYIRVDYNGEPVSLPFYFWDFNEFYKSATDKQFIYGAYFAILFIIAIFMIIASIIGKSSLLVYYTFFVLSITFFLMSLSGFSYEYFYPSYPSIRNIDLPFFGGAVALFFVFFSIEILNLDKYLPKWKKIFYWLIYILIIQIIGVPIFMNNIIDRDFYQALYIFTIFLTFSFVLVISLYLLFKTRAFKYKLFFVAYIIELFGLMTYVFGIYDVIQLNLFTRFAIYYTVLIELIIFSIYLINRLIGIKKDNLSMSLELSVQKQKALNGIMLGEQSERKRLSNELHDGLGLHLSTIKTKLSDIQVESDKDKMKLNQILQDVDDACNSIRIISHNLSPYKIEEDGLESALKDLFHQLNLTYDDIDFKLNYSLNKDELPKFIEANLYRGIKEMIQNIIKHSKATKAILIVEKNEEGDYLVQMKDNGIGFNKEDKSTWGIGLKNIKSRVDYFDGDFIIDSKQGYGTLITIRFTLPENPV